MSLKSDSCRLWATWWDPNAKEARPPSVSIADPPNWRSLCSLSVVPLETLGDLDLCLWVFQLELCDPIGFPRRSEDRWHLGRNAREDGRRRKAHAASRVYGCKLQRKLMVGSTIWMGAEARGIRTQRLANETHSDPQVSNYSCHERRYHSPGEIPNTISREGAR